MSTRRNRNFIFILSILSIPPYFISVFGILPSQLLIRAKRTIDSIPQNYDFNTITIMCISIRGGSDDSPLKNNTDIENRDHEQGIQTYDTDDEHDEEEEFLHEEEGAIFDERERIEHLQSYMNETISTSPDIKTDIYYKSLRSGKTMKQEFSTLISSWKNETKSKAKKLFLNKISLVSSSLLKTERDTEVDTDQYLFDSEIMLSDDDELGDEEITHQSDLMRPGRKIFVVTTASIPWFTGTAVNPLLRAAYLCRMTKEINQRNNTSSSPGNNNTYIDIMPLANETSTSQTESMVTLVIPWLELEEDRLELYGPNHPFQTMQDQEKYIRRWLREDAGMPEEANETSGLKILFYPARYHSGLKSIFAMGDILNLIPEVDADVCILEEPEHLNWYRAPGEGWTKKFNFVIGIIHTNYVEYASSHYSGLWTAPAIRVMSSAMVRAYCHVVIKLSDTLQTFAPEKERTSNVHGVRNTFLEEGRKKANIYFEKHAANNYYDKNNSLSTSSHQAQVCDELKLKSNEKGNTTAYFIGKILWTKGLEKMLELESFYRQCTGHYFPIDIYGNGPEEKEIKRAFHGRNFRSANRHKNTDTGNMKKAPLNDGASNGDDFLNGDQDNSFISDSDISSSEYDEIDAVDGLVSSFSQSVAEISKRIKSTTMTLKTTTEYLDIELPKSRYELRRNPIPAKFPGRVDHGILTDYKVFVNPSITEVLCTTTAEALAMGKFVIIPVHPSNRFFLQFPNCLAYRNKLEFAANLHWALSHDPEPLSPEHLRLFTWEAATERLVQASAISRREAKMRKLLGTTKLDQRIAWFHNELGKGNVGDALRRVLGGGPVSGQHEYEMTKRQSNQDEVGSNGLDDDGISTKFLRSSLTEAIRKTLADMMLVPGLSTTRVIP